MGSWTENWHTCWIRSLHETMCRLTTFRAAKRLPRPFLFVGSFPLKPVFDRPIAANGSPPSRWRGSFLVPYRPEGGSAEPSVQSAFSVSGLARAVHQSATTMTSSFTSVSSGESISRVPIRCLQITLVQVLLLCSKTQFHVSILTAAIAWSHYHQVTPRTGRVGDRHTLRYFPAFNSVCHPQTCSNPRRHTTSRQWVCGVSTAPLLSTRLAWPPVDTTSPLAANSVAVDDSTFPNYSENRELFGRTRSPALF
jgi:hypothetical protein